MRDAHQKLGSSIRVAAAERLTGLELAVDWVHVGTRETKAYHLDVVLKLNT